RFAQLRPTLPIHVKGQLGGSAACAFDAACAAVGRIIGAHGCGPDEEDGTDAGDIYELQSTGIQFPTTRHLSSKLLWTAPVVGVVVLVVKPRSAPPSRRKRSVSESCARVETALDCSDDSPA